MKKILLGQRGHRLTLSLFLVGTAACSPTVAPKVPAKVAHHDDSNPATDKPAPQLPSGSLYLQVIINNEPVLPNVLKQDPVSRARDLLLMRSVADKRLAKLNYKKPFVREGIVSFPFEIEGVAVYSVDVLFQDDGFDTVRMPDAASMPIPMGAMPKDKTDLLFVLWQGKLRLIRIKRIKGTNFDDMIEWVDPTTNEVLLHEPAAIF